MKNNDRSIYIVFSAILVIVIVLGYYAYALNQSHFTITEEVCTEKLTYLTEINRKYMEENNLESDFLFILEGNNRIEGNSLFQYKTVCTDEPRDFMTYNSWECTDELERKGYICLDGKIPLGISINGLTTEWLNENAECVETKKSCMQGRDDCAKWTFGNYTVEVGKR